MLKQKLLVALGGLSYDFLKLDNELFAFLEFYSVLVFFANEEPLQLTLLIVVLVNNRVVLRLELSE